MKEMSILPESYHVRPPSFEDLERTTELLAACDIADYGMPHYSLGMLHSNWIGLDLERDAWLVFTDKQQLVGYAGVWYKQPMRMFSTINVHPDYRGQEIEKYLLCQTEARAEHHFDEAPQGTRITLNTWVSCNNEASERFLKQEGYELVRHFWQMVIELDEPTPYPALPSGIDIQTFDPVIDSQPVYEAVEESFQDHWGHHTPSFEEWSKSHLDGEDYDPSLILVARAGGEVAGVAICHEGEDGGWVEQLAVRRPWRRQGLGTALLMTIFNEFYLRGVQKVGLLVDAQNQTGATRIYQRAGMQIELRRSAFQKELQFSKVKGLAELVGTIG
ncbi:MAG TPA: GNAT family N-acetyltransferase [Ktedonobacteraceae bacterium]|nr:GNAT family N-acetyltransferase [Ktedonobacteraceae bacterium]